MDIIITIVMLSIPVFCLYVVLDSRKRTKATIEETRRLLDK